MLSKKTNYKALITATEASRNAQQNIITYLQTSWIFDQDTQNTVAFATSILPVNSADNGIFRRVYKTAKNDY
jgi:hypothetical protein